MTKEIKDYSDTELLKEVGKLMETKTAKRMILVMQELSHRGITIQWKIK